MLKKIFKFLYSNFLYLEYTKFVLKNAKIFEW